MGTHAGWVVFTPIFDRTLTLPMGGLYYLKPAPWGPMTRSMDWHFQPSNEAFGSDL